MDLKKFLELPATGDFRLLNKIDNITDIPVENISLLEPPVENSSAGMKLSFHRLLL